MVAESVLVRSLGLPVDHLRIKRERKIAAVALLLVMYNLFDLG